MVNVVRGHVATLHHSHSLKNKIQTLRAWNTDAGGLILGGPEGV